MKTVKQDKVQDGFAYVRIHKIMINDKTRTLAYKRAIEDNVRKDDVVMDIGCGSGILSFFAAKRDAGRSTP